MTTKYSATPLQLASAFVVLFVIWLLWSGLYKPLLIGLGAFSCLLSVWLAKRTGFFRHAIPLPALLRLPALWLWILGEVIKSSFEVARIVLSPSLPIQPQLISLNTTEDSDVAKVILGNSITLSPGTVTIDIDKGQLLVHCLTDESAASLQNGETDRRLAKVGIR